MGLRNYAQAGKGRERVTLGAGGGDREDKQSQGWEAENAGKATHAPWIRQQFVFDKDVVTWPALFIPAELIALDTWSINTYRCLSNLIIIN